MRTQVRKNDIGLIIPQPLGYGKDKGLFSGGGIQDKPTEVRKLQPVPPEGFIVTDANGDYTFKTIKPGHYPVSASWTRPSHVHFKVSAGLQARMLTTQMYFAGDPHLKADRLLNSVPKAEQARLVVEPTRRPGENSEDSYGFDISLVRLTV